MGTLQVSHMLILVGLIICVILLWLARSSLPLIRIFMTKHGMLQPNYQGQQIATGCGILIWLLVLVNAIVMNGLAMLFRGYEGLKGFDQLPFVSYVAALCAVAIVGFADDAIGDKAVKGLKGHWLLWKEKQICSTGQVKAVVTGIAALLFVSSITYNSWWHIGADLLLLGLMTNGVNLLDVRPGRALKGFLMITAAGTIVQLVVNAVSGQLHIDELLQMAIKLAPYVMPVYIGACVLLGPDLRAELMIGDTGANMLGFAAGCWVILGLAWQLQAVLIVFMLVLHIMAWRSSVSRWIEANRLLLWFDLLGRNKNKTSS
ncbi:hypothetical protein [Paenibacillus periandrae]|uniref:hypothetical protein n=1 Tax=Paenibacillus periandrae TaxID=1761741 RepID=UPI001F09C7C0|nr:hypothetical protein [Paenibacillus periandrae]